MNSVAEQVTAIIKAYERPDRLLKLVASIRDHYPDLPVVIVDDSRERLDHDFDENIQYIHTEHDIGLSRGRNIAAQNVYTPYTLLLDDDYLFTEQTKIEDMLQILNHENADIVSGDVYDFGKLLRVCHGSFDLGDNKLYLVQGKEKEFTENGRPLFDYLINFFLARTQFLKESPWDDDLKIREHEHFFWKMKKLNARLIHTNTVQIEHFPTSEEAKDNFYNDQRVNRMKYYHELACEKIGVSDIQVEYSNLLGYSSSIARLGNRIASYLFLNKEKSIFLKGLWSFLTIIRPPVKSIIMKAAIKNKRRS